MRPFPPDLHQKIHAAASDAGRTFNAELVSRLEQSFAEELVTRSEADMEVAEAVGAAYRYAEARFKDISDALEELKSRLAAKAVKRAQER